MEPNNSTNSLGSDSDSELNINIDQLQHIRIHDRQNTQCIQKQPKSHRDPNSGSIIHVNININQPAVQNTQPSQIPIPQRDMSYKLPRTGTRGIFYKLQEKFCTGKGRTSYPLGIDSGPSTSTSPPDLISSDIQDNGDNGDEEPLVSWQPYEQSVQNGMSSMHCCNPSYASSPSSASSDTSSDSFIMEPNLILNSNVKQAIAKKGTHNMYVRPATICHNNTDEDYKMTAKPRGPCLIVNNIDFEAEIFPTRKGSDEDARRFDSIFQQLGFTVIMRRNQTADQMRRLFAEVASECKPEHDALFVFILSHGSEHGIYGTDGIEVHLDSEIISCFDNRNCKAMLGKPKVFVIQACRGRAKDCGGEGDTTDSIALPPDAGSVSPIAHTLSQDNRVPTSWLPTSSSQIDGKKRKHPIRTDILLIFSCLAGYVSVRNELAGSWLGVALAYFIMTHAHERDLQRILNLVNHDVIQRESSNGHMQAIETRGLGWTKNLYFNPGIYM